MVDLGGVQPAAAGGQEFAFPHLAVPTVDVRGTHRAQADRLELIEWNERMRLGGPAQLSPTLGAAMRYGYRFLRVRCSTCRQTAFVALSDLDRAPETLVWQLEGVLACQECRSQGARAPRGIIEGGRSARTWMSKRPSP